MTTHRYVFTRISCLPSAILRPGSCGIMFCRSNGKEKPRKCSRSRQYVPVSLLWHLVGYFEQRCMLDSIWTPAGHRQFLPSDQNLTHRFSLAFSQHASRVADMIDKFVSKAPQQYKLSGVYLIDSICKKKDGASRQCRSEFGSRMDSILRNALEGSEKDRVRYRDPCYHSCSNTDSLYIIQNEEKAFVRVYRVFLNSEALARTFNDQENYALRFIGLN
jgi:hypothetical protein